MDAAALRDLAERGRKGDGQAIACLWIALRPVAAATVLARSPAGCDPEDLLQEVAAAFVERIRELRQPDRVVSWLRAIAFHIAAGAGRQEGRRRRHLRPLGPGEPPDPDSAPSIEDDDHARRVLAATLRLPAEYREPLLLRAVRGLSQKAIAEALDLPVTTIETRLVRARRMLRAALERAENPSPSTPLSAPAQRVLP